MTQAQQPAPDPIPAPSDQRLYVVDRVEGGIVVLIAEDAPAEAGALADPQAPADPQEPPNPPALPDEEVLASALGVPVREGDMLRVPVGADGGPEWSEAAPDPAARAERLSEAEARIARLRKRDPGGDIVL